MNESYITITMSQYLNTDTQQWKIKPVHWSWEHKEPWR